MITRMTTALAAFGLAVLTASAAFATEDGYQFRQDAAGDLAQQFDAVAPNHADSAGYTRAMALREKAGVNYSWGHYERAIGELRSALHDIDVYPTM